MIAAQIENYGEKIGLKKQPVPRIGKKDLLVKVIAASINPIDLKTKDGKMKLLLHYKMPLTLGSDFAGIVVARGEQVKKFQVGDAVYGRVQKNRIGTFAEYIAVDVKDVALKPKNLTFAKASSIPLVALTSYQALHEVMKIKPQDKILIQAGSGGIGTLAIQLAKLAGAYVATTTSEKNRALVKSLGADEVIDYRSENFAEKLKDYDFVFDTMGGDILKDAFKIVKPGGKVVTLSGTPNYAFAKNYNLPLWKQIALGIASYPITKLAQKTDVSYDFLFMRPDGNQLAALTKLIEAKQLQPIIDSVISLAEIQKAVDNLASGRAKGKIILAVDEKLAQEF
ncbi:NADP-dependent oxidoreductase [Enterococcus canintestini]|uniref:NADP-dependent oxidoreductase n=1 Tax=Enterococcus canintestini TaxID=317010 RepID=UPI00288E7BF0|nr:NADP-dependent oxidoreductase [Enterococcus canintestini]MDT2740055.1 NADP-dependent oxidoreductase [Enterococcus canintestini]